MFNFHPKRRKSLLFVNPDYHCSFFLRDEFRRLGWRADVLKNSGYPETLLWEDSCVEGPDNMIGRLKYLLYLARNYKYFICYGDEAVFATFSTFPGAGLLNNILGSWELALLRTLGCKLIFFPNGCRQEVLRRDFGQFQEGRVCANCGWNESVCTDKINAKTFYLLNKYYSLVIDNTPIKSARIHKTPVKYKSLDLDVYKPDLDVPEHLRIGSPGIIKVMHSFFDANRSDSGKNIKGSGFVIQAIKELQSEGYPVEQIWTNNTSLRQMRFIQSQADIIVDQLIYGWWGSTAIEAMALGKPTICFLWPEWKKRFLDSYPEYTELPIIEADVGTIYDVLKNLLDNPKLMEQKGIQSREFAVKHFDVKKNARDLAEMISSLK